MTNAELLTNFKKFNKKAREIRAKRLGYQSAARIRQVDPRTIIYVIVNGIKYNLK